MCAGWVGGRLCGGAHGPGELSRRENQTGQWRHRTQDVPDRCQMWLEGDSSGKERRLVGFCDSQGCKDLPLAFPLSSRKQPLLRLVSCPPGSPVRGAQINVAAGGRSAPFLLPSLSSQHLSATFPQMSPSVWPWELLPRSPSRIWKDRWQASSSGHRIPRGDRPDRREGSRQGEDEAGLGLDGVALPHTPPDPDTVPSASPGLSFSSVALEQRAC